MEGNRKSAVPVYGAGIGGTGQVMGTAEAPAYAREHFSPSCGLEVAWRQVCSYQGTCGRRQGLDEVAQFSQDLATVLQSAVEQAARPLIISGDHTAAVGVWSAVAAALPSPLGLIWVDAHMDLHTSKTSHSGNLHGMCLASLLGLGDARFTNLLRQGPQFLPRHVVLLGARDYEAEEHVLARRLKLRWYSSATIAKRGFQAVLAEAEAYLLEEVKHYGLSFDLDFLSSEEVGGVGTPAEGGLGLNDCLRALKTLNKKALRAVEIAELNPLLDKDNKAVKALWRLAAALFAE